MAYITQIRLISRISQAYIEYFILERGKLKIIVNI